jgi:hypothetical protein
MTVQQKMQQFLKSVLFCFNKFINLPGICDVFLNIKMAQFILPRAAVVVSRGVEFDYCFVDVSKTSCCSVLKELISQTAF